jgi:hypothetical protein
MNDKRGAKRAAFVIEAASPAKGDPRANQR